MRKTINIGNLSIDLICEWDQFKSKNWNWQEFHLIMLRFEKENLHGMFEIEFYLLGLGKRIYWTWNKELLKKKIKEYKKILKEETFINFEK